MISVNVMGSTTQCIYLYNNILKNVCEYDQTAKIECHLREHDIRFHITIWLQIENRHKTVIV